MGKLSKNVVSATLVKVGTAALFVFGLAACPFTHKTETDPPAEDPCFDYATFDKSEAATFTADVLPIFRKSCGLNTSCHGTQSGLPGQPYLGPALSAGATVPSAQIDAIFAQNVNVFAKKAPTMRLIEPSSPETSFLMHKIDGTFMCEDVKCEGDCGALMPKDAAALSSEERDIVRRWIAQGAKKD
jgi:hypothetical protein